MRVLRAGRRGRGGAAVIHRGAGRGTAARVNITIRPVAAGDSSRASATAASTTMRGRSGRGRSSRSGSGGDSTGRGRSRAWWSPGARSRRCVPRRWRRHGVHRARRRARRGESPRAAVRVGRVRRRASQRHVGFVGGPPEAPVFEPRSEYAATGRLTEVGVGLDIAAGARWFVRPELRHCGLDRPRRPRAALRQASLAHRRLAPVTRASRPALSPANPRSGFPAPQHETEMGQTHSGGGNGRGQPFRPARATAGSE